MDVKLDLPYATVIDAKLPYRSLIGSLLWIARMTRPDIAFAMSYLSQFNCAYDARHYDALKRVLKYLYSTKDHVLVIEPTVKSTDLSIGVSSDSGWARHKLDRKSFSGSQCTLNGAVVDWSCGKQRTVSTSPCEAEYYAACEGGKHGLHIKHMLEEITAGSDRFHLKLPMLLNVDNKGAIALSQNTINNRRSRHYEIWMYAVRDWVRKKWYAPRHVAGATLPVDAMTKPLGRIDLERKRIGLGVSRP